MLNFNYWWKDDCNPDFNSSNQIRDKGRLGLIWVVGYVPSCSCGPTQSELKLIETYHRLGLDHFNETFSVAQI